MKRFTEGMKSWQVELTSGEENLGEVNIRPWVFQGDPLSPLLTVLCVTTFTNLKRCCTRISFASNKQKNNHLLFMDDMKLYASNEKSLESLIQTVRMFSNDTGMKILVEKCTVLTMKKG